jgi:hypothetical protein
MRTLLILTFINLQIFAQKQPLSNRIANYDIDVKLDVNKKTLTGKQTLYWKNTSTDNITELQFHAYLNAFKDKNSTFMKESGGQLRGDKLEKEDKNNWGNISISSMKIRGGESIYSKIKFFQPDDLNENDKTVFKVQLPKPLKPNESIAIDIDFKAKLPKIFARTGFVNDYFLIAQWFPKIGIYESAGVRYATKGQWNCHQFHAHSEFYADFGVYRVNMTVPKEYVIGATGVFQNEKINADGTKTISYKAEDVHDFAWTASPKYVVSERQWKHVKIKAMMMPEHSGIAERYFQSAEVALAYFEKNLGRYPHPVLTLVGPPLAASGAFGMEYPTFITCGGVWGLPSGMRFPEIVTVHEFGHQYFQGILASNEFEESFLDEGFNQYYEGRIMDENYGKGSQINLLGFKVGDTESNRESYVGMKDPTISQSFRKSWEYPKGTYSILTYTKPATWLKTLENLIGRTTMDEIMQTYYIRWRFRHPSVKDFIEIVNEIVPKRLGNQFGENMDWYFEQVLYKSPSLDYSIQIKDSQKEIQIERKGEMIIPTEILVKFEDGTEKTMLFDGKLSKKNLKFDKNVAFAKIDPNQKILLDLNFINNSYAVNPNRTPFVKYAMKMMFWVQNLMLGLG